MNGTALRRLLQIVFEFISALADRRTYMPRNPYLWFGLAWGIPVPVFALAIDLLATGEPFSMGGAATALSRRPIHAFFLVHPLLFAVVFGALGTLRRRQDAEIESLLGQQKRHIAQLRELDRLKAEFVANMTHELKTPLVSILGYNEMIADGRLGGINERQKRGLEISLRNVQRLQTLIEEMLISSRIDAGMLQVNPKPFVAAELLEQTARSMDPVAARRRQRIELSLPPDDVRVQGDPEWISRVVANLLSNAIKFSPEGAVIRVGAHAADGTVKFFVSDEGPGIPEEFRPHLFERFRQAESGLTRANGGTGLGLAIVKGILDAHGVEIEVQSEPGRGTTFSFNLREVKP